MLFSGTKQEPLSPDSARQSIGSPLATFSDTVPPVAHGGNNANQVADGSSRIYGELQQGGGVGLPGQHERRASGVRYPPGFSPPTQRHSASPRIASASHPHPYAKPTIRIPPRHASARSASTSTLPPAGAVAFPAPSEGPTAATGFVTTDMVVPPLNPSSSPLRNPQYEEDGEEEDEIEDDYEMEDGEEEEREEEEDPMQPGKAGSLSAALSLRDFAKTCFPTREAFMSAAGDDEDVVANFDPSAFGFGFRSKG